METLILFFFLKKNSGNFQQNNRQKGGRGNDAVKAVLDVNPQNRNNAYFATFPDGQTSEMTMFTWDYTSPKRQSSLDFGVVAHEYMHGVSTRLTGGGLNVGCLNYGHARGFFFF